MDDRQNNTTALTTTPSFQRGQPPSRWVGVLTPIAGLSATVIQVEQDERVVGRDRDCGAVLSDEGVSRQHARITREGDEFVLEDLDSFNGSHVDGVPVLSCVLHDGDTVQLGQNLYTIEIALRPRAAGPEREDQQ
jgi:pSer/pThr/pTyr-binding forkhead associated (FHA) protein